MEAMILLIHIMPEVPLVPLVSNHAPVHVVPLITFTVSLCFSTEVIHLACTIDRRKTSFIKKCLFSLQIGSISG